MKDGRVRRVVKGVARIWYMLELRASRRVRRLHNPPRFEMGGECRRCARCCEEPTIRVGAVLWYAPRLRRAFLWWQRVVNGFELLRTELDGRLFVFRCTHFDPDTRLCDSYESRPAQCRDYPRALFDQPWPELFEQCGYRPVDTQGGSLSEALDRADIPIEARALLKKKLHLDG